MVLDQPPEIGDPDRISITTTDDTDDGGTSWRDKLSRRSGTAGSATGSGSVTTTVDPDTGRASQSITGTGSGGSTPEADENNVTAGVTGPSAALPDLRDLEQDVEDTTGGAAFGDPNEQETIDQNTSRTTAGGGRSTDAASPLNGAVSEVGGLSGKVLIAAAALAAVVAFGGD